MKQWDSPQMALQFIVGLFLVIGLFSSVIYGTKQLSFLIKFGQSSHATTIDLTKKDIKNIPAGAVEIIGYPSYEISDVYTDYTGDLLDEVTYFYFALLHKPGEKISDQSPLILIKRKKITSTYTTETQQPLSQNGLVTIRGIVGYHADTKIKKTIQNQFFNDFSSGSNKIVLLDESKHVPTFKKLLLWFLPVIVGFTAGLLLVIRWIFALKIQYFSSSSDNQR